jgi:hypothetical protein
MVFEFEKGRGVAVLGFVNLECSEYCPSNLELLLKSVGVNNGFYCILPT